jgi:hypothetical protein
MGEYSLPSVEDDMVAQFQADYDTAFNSGTEEQLNSAKTRWGARHQVPRAASPACLPRAAPHCLPACGAASGDGNSYRSRRPTAAPAAPRCPG